MIRVYRHAGRVRNEYAYSPVFDGLFPITPFVVGFQRPIKGTGGQQMEPLLLGDDVRRGWLGKGGHGYRVGVAGV